MSAADLAALELMSADDRLAAEMAAVAPYFDAEHYAATLPALAPDVTDPLLHFCTTGWRELRNPHRDFDIWWYWVNHLDPAEDTINPLVHHAFVGHAAGLSTKPPTTASGPGAVLPRDRPVRRVSLFAGFDVDGIVDESTLMMVRELARFGDVYCLFDCELRPGELDKLREHSVGAWAERHGAYDFGSYARLAAELVGWEHLATYDEVLFVNDSSYLVRPLDETFARMDAESCDWWGMQATKGIAMTRDVPENHFPDPVPLDVVRNELLPRFEESVTYDFLVGSYFLAFRSPVVSDPLFRRLMESVVPQGSKRLIVRKYEVGLTRLLIGRGHRFSTFVEALYPFHPVYSAWVFSLIAEGFPLFKRFLLQRNHYDVPGLDRWKERLRELVPEAPIEIHEQNLLRVTPADRLHRSLSITADADGTVHVPQKWDALTFRKADRGAPKRPDVWVFAVDRFTGLLPPNGRAILEQIRGDDAITPVVLTREYTLDLGDGVTETPLRSPEGERLLIEAGVVLISGRPRWAVQAPLHLEGGRFVVGVREGLRLNRHSQTAAAPNPDGPTGPAVPDRPFMSLLLTASAMDEAEAVASHWPVAPEASSRAGLPFHDVLIRDEPPAWLADSERRVREELRGRPLVLVAPAGGEPPLPAPVAERLADWADAVGAVIGVRENGRRGDFRTLSAFGGRALDLSTVRHREVAAVLRATAVLVTDHADVALDFTVTGRPVLGLDFVAAPDDETLYPVDRVFPGPRHRHVEPLVADLDAALSGAPATLPARYEAVRDLFVDRLDGSATERTIALIRDRPKEDV